MRFGEVELELATAARIVARICGGLAPGTLTTISLPIVNVWMLRLCNSWVSCWIVSWVAGAGDEG